MRTSRQVLDYLAWMEHCVYVQAVCHDPLAAYSAFKLFTPSAAAERGRNSNAQEG